MSGFDLVSVSGIPYSTVGTSCAADLRGLTLENSPSALPGSCPGHTPGAHRRLVYAFQAAPCFLLLHAGI